MVRLTAMSRTISKIKDEHQRDDDEVNLRKGRVEYDEEASVDNSGLAENLILQSPMSVDSHSGHFLDPVEDRRGSDEEVRLKGEYETDS
jgi:hypothetical protein